jgi:predicted HTH transcriptional regulator
MTDEEFIELVAAGERPGVEFKNARGRKDPSFKEVVRAVLGMANRRDGGVIIIGVDDNGTATGLTEPQRASWQQADHIRQAIAPFADPFVYVDVELKMVLSEGSLKGRIFVILVVQEFEDVPVLCGKAGNDANGQPLLQPGACYVRPNHMPATTNIANQTQFRALLELAIEKGVRKFLRTARAVGLATEGAPAPDDTALFRTQAARIDE